MDTKKRDSFRWHKRLFMVFGIVALVGALDFLIGMSSVLVLGSIWGANWWTKSGGDWIHFITVSTGAIVAALTGMLAWRLRGSFDACDKEGEQ